MEVGNYIVVCRQVGQQDSSESADEAEYQQGIRFQVLIQYRKEIDIGDYTPGNEDQVVSAVIADYRKITDQQVVKT